MVVQARARASAPPPSNIRGTASSKTPLPRHGVCLPAVAKLGEGVIWLCAPEVASQAWARELAPRLCTFARTQAQAAVPLPPDAVSEALIHRGDCCGDAVRVLQPESSSALNCCKWDGDGHFDVSLYPGPSPPTLGQVIAHLRDHDAATSAVPLVVHLTPHDRLGTGAVLAGAVLVLVHGKSAQDAWTEVLQGCPVARAACSTREWARFSPTFSRNGATSESSLTVFDCLAGLAAARDLGWLEDYTTFDLDVWYLMRRKFDASWVIPRKVLAFGDPQVTAQNPCYPELGKAGEAEHSNSWPSGLSRKSTTSDLSSPASAAPNSVDDDLALRRLPVNELKAESFAAFFLRTGIRDIVRLNSLSECEQVQGTLTSLADAGVQVLHYEFQDCSVPSQNLLRGFLAECSDSLPSFAIHCKAGLGRTGIMAGAYAVKCHGIDAKAFHGWIRLCRPGSVQTPAQERFLRSLKPKANFRASCYFCP